MKCFPVFVEEDRECPEPIKSYLEGTCDGMATSTSDCSSTRSSAMQNIAHCRRMRTTLARPSLVV